MSQEKSIFLRNTQAGHNKDYNVFLRPFEKGWAVVFEYGRHGNTLRPGRKNAEPLSYDAAHKLWEKVVASQLNSGYQETGRQGNSSAGSIAVRQQTHLLPQLCLAALGLRDIPSYITDATYGLQEKMDGDRCMVAIAPGEDLVVSNKQGLARALPDKVAAALRKLKLERTMFLDGELIGESYYVFELVIPDRMLVPCQARYEMLRDLLPKKSGTLKLVPMYFTIADKEREYRRIVKDNGEGVVFKLLNGVSKPGDRSGDWLKFKFKATASVIVVEQSATTRSVVMCVLDNSGKRVRVGKVTIPANHEVPSPEDVIEVEYLYAFRGGAMFQSVYKGPRNDVSQLECTIGQLKYKKEEDE